MMNAIDSTNMLCTIRIIKSQGSQLLNLLPLYRGEGEATAVVVFVGIGSAG